MTKDEALKLALEALEPFGTPRWAGTGVDKANEAIIAIKEALAAPVQVNGSAGAHRARRKTMNTEDDEFNRIERESIARKLAVKYAISKVVHIPEITEEEWKALNEYEENLRKSED
jgi:hypothetical protein